MSKLDVLPKFSSAKRKSHHPMSHALKFTCAAGHLNPVESDLLYPGDKIDFQPVFQVRCAQPLLAAAMADIDFHVDTFFVPMTMLYSPFESFIYGVNEFYSSKYDSSAKGGLPLLNFLSLINQLSVNAQTANPYKVASSLPETQAQSYVRLASLLGYSTAVGYDSQSITNFEFGGFQPNSFPYALLAYNCIYQNYYRLDEYTKFNPATFNWDNINAGTYSPMVGSTTEVPFYCCQYHPMYGDYFTRIKRSPLINELNLIDGSSSPLLTSYSDLSSNNILALYKGGSISPDTNGRYPYNQGSPISLGNENVVANTNSLASTTPTGGSYQSINQIRTLFANEKLLMVTARARKNYDAQTLAHFGVNVPHDVKHDLSRLGSDSFTLAINELVSTADTQQSTDGKTTGAALGEYFGKGLAGKQTKRIKFTAPCHGVLMCIFSCVPRFDYLVEFMKKNFIQTRLDFYQPEYDALGMQPVYRYEVTRVSGGTSYSTDIVSRNWAYDVQGWQYRYEQFKRNFNRATPAFSAGIDSVSPYSAWALTRRPFDRYSHVPYRDAISNNQRPYIGNGTRAAGSTTEWVDYYADNYNYHLYVMPSDLNQLFAGSYFYGWKLDDTMSEQDRDKENWSRNLWQVFARDPFVVNSYFRYDKYSIMSTYSMPNLM